LLFIFHDMAVAVSLPVNLSEFLQITNSFFNIPYRPGKMIEAAVLYLPQGFKGIYA